MSDPAEMPERDAQGRFAKGNSGGPGNPAVRRQAENQAAFHEVMTPQRFKMLLTVMLKAAVERQDMRAARILFDRTLGKPRSEPLHELALDLPSGLESAGDVAKAANALLQGIASGAISPEDAHRAAAVVELARRAIETQELDRRISELEERAKSEKRR